MVRRPHHRAVRLREVHRRARLWPEQAAHTLDWPADHSILDVFPEALSVKDVTGLLSAVGFSSPPAWLRPHAVLSTGQQFRVSLARLLAEALAETAPQPIVLDEFTSVVDRTVAQDRQRGPGEDGSAARPALRRRDLP